LRRKSHLLSPPGQAFKHKIKKKSIIRSMNIYLEIISITSVRAISIYIFLFIILLCFIKNILFQNNADGKGTQKIIGGLSVFVIAVLSENAWIIFTSLFIGGLIIASEEFMENLAIIVRSKSEDIGENLKYSKASPAEIEEKQESEVIAEEAFKKRLPERLKETKAALSETKKTINTSSFLIKMRTAEKLVTNFLGVTYGSHFHPQVKAITKEKVPLILDGLLDSHREITTIFEIKYLSSLILGNMTIRRTVEHLRFYFKSENIVICLVTETSTSKQRNDLKKFIKPFENVSILFFELKDSNIKLIEGNLE